MDVDVLIMILTWIATATHMSLLLQFVTCCHCCCFQLISAILCAPLLPLTVDAWLWMFCGCFVDAWYPRTRANRRPRNPPTETHGNPRRSTEIARFVRKLYARKSPGDFGGFWWGCLGGCFVNVLWGAWAVVLWCFVNVLLICVLFNVCFVLYWNGVPHWWWTKSCM